MSGQVFYKFGSQKELSTVPFDGTGITVFDLKREIIERQHMGKSADFDFAIYHAESGEEYRNDHTVIPRATSVLARRLPPSRPGRGNAQFYVSENISGMGTQAPPGRSSARQTLPSSSPRSFDKPRSTTAKSRPIDSTSKENQSEPLPAPATGVGGDDEEASKIAAMFAEEDEQWKQAQEKIPKFNNARGPQGQRFDPKPVPGGYVCYRCGQKGHWIQDCPTNENKDFDMKSRVKRTTGIPRSFLTTVEGPSDNGGVMMTPEGGYVVARPDSATWNKQKKMTRRNISAEEVQQLQPTDPDLACPLCTRLLKNAVKTPCCHTSYCENCITEYLYNNDNICPECESVVEDVSLLQADNDRRERVQEYIDEVVKNSRDESTDEAETRNGTPVPTTDEVSKRLHKEDETEPLNQSNNVKGEADNTSESKNDQSVRMGSKSPNPASVGINSPKDQNFLPLPDNAQMMKNYQAQNMGAFSQGMQIPGMGTGMPPQMMQGNIPGMGNGMFPKNPMMMKQTPGAIPPNPQMIQQMLQQSMHQFNNNPNLPPPMRMQLQAQIQQLQAMLMQNRSQQVNNVSMPMNMNMNAPNQFDQNAPNGQFVMGRFNGMPGPGVPPGSGQMMGIPPNNMNPQRYGGMGGPMNNGPFPNNNMFQKQPFINNSNKGPNSYQQQTPSMVQKRARPTEESTTNDSRTSKESRKS